MNQKNYLLVEFNEIAIPPVMDQTLHEMQLAGIRPIITHPERNRLLADCGRNAWPAGYGMAATGK